MMTKKCLYLLAIGLLYVFEVESVPIDCRKYCSGGLSLNFNNKIQCSCRKRLGDLILTTEQMEWIEAGNQSSRARAGDALLDLWITNQQRDGFYRIPFVYSSLIHSKKEHVKVINKAISVMNALTCLRFEPAIPGADVNKVEFIYGRGCSSPVGKRGGTQKISIGKYCVNTGTVLHEIMHTLGFWHEHSRHDRDDYVKIHLQNILDDATKNFFKKPENEINTYNSPYDFASVLHYSSFAFSSNSKATITRIGSTQPIVAQRAMLSNEDLFQLRAMYKCDGLRGIPETSGCMHPIDRGVSYRGTISRTASGIECQRWDSNTPHSHFYSPSLITGAGLEMNYCRNPNVDDLPWCYTTDKKVEKEHCNIPICNPAVQPVANPLPLQSVRGFWTEYSSWSACEATCGEGRQLRLRTCIGGIPGSQTCPGNYWEAKSCFASITCAVTQPTIGVTLGNWNQWQAWSSCGAACGTDSVYRIRSCSLDFCGAEVVERMICENSKCPLYPDKGCYDPTRPYSYKGEKSRAITGRKCMKWSRTSLKSSDLSALNLTLNYCRNPDGDVNGPYCFTNKKEKKKYCQVSSCNSQAAWSTSSVWSSCTASCGGGVKYQTRTCLGGVISQGSCTGGVIISVRCNTQGCGDSVISSITSSEVPTTEVPTTEAPDFYQPVTEGVGCANVGEAAAYRGTASTTYKGLKCQHWDSLYPHDHHYRTIQQFRDGGLVENYCRAPEEGDEWPWCYVLSHDVVKQVCDIPVCQTASLTLTGVECFDVANPQGYRGSVSTTSSGYQCQRWDENQPHPHLSFKPFRTLNQGLGPHNYCRNPDGDSLPWCITTNPNRFWEHCNVTLC